MVFLKPCLLIIIIIISTLVQAVPPEAGQIIYINPCIGGCTFTSVIAGEDNSILNTTSLIDTSTLMSTTANITEFQGTTQIFNQVKLCLAEKFLPFDVMVTDVDPGMVPHTELVVSGSPEELGLPMATGGIAPFNCGYMNNVPVFVFANIYGGNVEEICHIGAQKVANSYGIEHHYYCPDIMTFVSGCGAKSFVDFDAQCGEFSPRNCDCGGATQNSFQMMNGFFGMNPNPQLPPIFKDGFE